jgi:hypothetical protein
MPLRRFLMTELMFLRLMKIGMRASAPQQAKLPALSRAQGAEMTGAGERIRTVDILLGKQTLCQLSYTRPDSMVSL